MSFEQFAQGTMNLEVLGRFHCGPDNTSPRDLAWEVLVVYPDGVLDNHGFLMDNLEFDKSFSAIKATRLSCELLAEHCCEELWKRTKGKAQELRTTIWAIPGRVRVTKIRKKDEGRREGA